MARLMCVLVLVWCLQSQVFAQVFPPCTLLVNQHIVVELRLSAEQEQQIKQALRPYTREVNGKTMFILRAGTDFDALDEKIAKVLEPSQVKRLREAWLRVHGVMALPDPTVSKELGLDDKMVKQINERIEKMNAEIRLQSRLGVDPKETVQIEKQIRADARQEIEEYLTAEQRSKLKSMQGAAFKNK